MNGTKLLVDTNILLYYLNGDKTLEKILDKKQLYVSVISELELLSFSKITEAETQLIKSLLSDCTIIELNEKIKLNTIEIRKKFKTKLPDSIIIASSLYLDIPIITADVGFKKVDKINLLFYEFHK